MPVKKTKGTYSQRHANLHMPKDIKKYKARKMQAIIRTMEQESSTKVNIKDYLMLLDAFGKICEEIRKDVKASRINKKHGTSEVQHRGDAGDQSEKSAHVGADVSTEDQDPFKGLSEL